MKIRSGFAKRTAAVFMAVIMSVSLLIPAAAASNKNQIDELKKEATSLNVKKNELKKKLSALGDDKEKAIEQKELLDRQCQVLQKEIENINAQITQYTALISETEGKIAETEAKEKAQYELFCKRVRTMEENGRVSYWEVIFKATSFADFLSRIDFINEIMDYDERIMNELKEIRNQLAEEKATLEESKAAQVAARTELNERKAELQTQLDAAIALVKKIRSQESEYQSTLKAYEKEEDDIQSKIVELSKQQDTSGPNAGTDVIHSQMGSGGYMWPVANSRKINSPFGPRKSPGGIGSRNHKGVDIGGVGYSSNVLASKAGKVIVSQYSRSYGNYVVISHASGNTTLYAHMSKRLVSAGQRVEQGQVLGITGSTGNSTGPHLHFEITEGGSRTDPLKYLTGYAKAW